MGAKGIRRRKPYRKLPPPEVPPNDVSVPPNVVWPRPGSGFEASPWSPAGRMQAGWRFLDGLGRRRSRRNSPVVAFVMWLVLGLLAAAVLVNVLVLVL